MACHPQGICHVVVAGRPASRHGAKAGTCPSRPAAGWPLSPGFPGAVGDGDELAAEGWVTGDEGFRNTPVLLDQISEAGVAYFMKVSTTCGAVLHGRQRRSQP